MPPAIRLHPKPPWEVFSDGLSHSAGERKKPSSKVRRARKAESETTGGPIEKPEQTACSVIQAGTAIGCPRGDSQTRKSPSSRCIRRKTGRVISNKVRPPIADRDRFR